MKQIQRSLAFLMVLCILVSMVPAVGAVAEQYAIGYVAAQADSANVHLMAEGDCTLVVALYGENGRMIDARTKAVTGAEGYQAIPVSLPETGAEEYDLKAFLLDNKTSAPLCSSYVLKNAGSAGELYAIAALAAEDGTISAAVSTQEACVLEVQIWDEDETELLYTGTAAAAEQLELENVSMDAPASLPSYFLMRAVMKDEDGNALSNPFTTRRYTQAYQTFETQTEADFKSRTDVTFLDIGTEDDGNFAVLNENVRFITCSDTANTLVSETDGVYTFENAGADLTGLQPGDLISFVDGDGQYATVKVKEITVQNGTVVITQDEDVHVADFYDVIKIDMNLSYEVEGAMPEAAALNAAAGSQSAQLFKAEYGPALKTNLTTPFGAVESTARAGGKVSISYAPKLLGDDYMDVTVMAFMKGELDVTIGAVKDFKDDFPLISIPLTGLKEVAGVSLNLELAAQIDCEFGYNTTVGYEAAYGIIYSTDTSMQVVREKNFTQNEVTSESKIKGEAEFEIGVRGELSVSLLNELVEASLGAEGGVVVDAELDLLSGLPLSGLDSYHACGVCINGSCKSYFEVDATLDYEINAFLKGNLFDFDFIRLETTLGSFYASLVNDEDSVHGGKVAFDWADSCPNKKYKIKFQTYDANNNEVEGCAVAIVNKDGEMVSSVISPGAEHLYSGTYTASTTVGPNAVVKTFTVSNGIQTVYLNGQNKILSGKVTNQYNGEVIPGASVQISQDGVAIETLTADSAGYYSKELPDGEYTVAFSADGYETKAYQATIMADKALDAKLESVPYTITFDANGGSGTRADMEFHYGQTVTLPACTFEPPEGKMFDAWLIGEVKCDAGTNYTPAAGDHTVKATWKDKAFTVTVTVQYEDGSAASFVSIDGTGLETAPKIYSSGTTTFDLPGGTYRLSVTTSENYYAVQTVELDSNKEITLILKPAEMNWSLDETTGVLTITGYGPMPDYDYYDGIYAPWYNQSSKITSAVVSGVSTIGAEAFESCNNMKSITLPEGLTSIKWYAFQYCVSLTSIDIPDSVTTIESGAFHRTGLTSIAIPDGVTTLGGGVFRECENLKRAVLPEGIGEVDSQQFYLCSSLESVVIPDSVTAIEEYAFGRCTALTDITLPSGLTTISQDAFEYCSALKEITIPDSVTCIERYAFAHCTALTTVRIPGSVTDGNSYNGWASAFGGCTGLVSVEITEGMPKIPMSYFYGCTALTSVVIPASVTAIEDYAFNNCTALSDIYYAGTQEQWEAMTIGVNNDVLSTATIHYNYTAAE